MINYFYTKVGGNMNIKLKMILWVLLGVITVALIGLCVYNLFLSKTQSTVHPEVSFEIENYGTIKMELYPEYAPNTVANIIKLVESGYYNDKVIYGKDEVCLYLGRNLEGEAINPKASSIDSSVEADSDKDYEYTIPGEFVANGFEKNTLRHEKGIISLIRSDYSQYFSELSEESYNSGNAQIGIIMNDARNLNGIYTAFGKITDGLEILEKMYQENKIKEVEKEEAEELENEIQEFETYPVIKSATVNTFGNDYGIPTIQEAFDYESYINEMLSSYYSTEQ